MPDNLFTLPLDDEEKRIQHEWLTKQLEKKSE